MIEFTEAAVLDLAGIDNATAAMWGPAQAERYLAYLDVVFAAILDNPRLVTIVDQHDEYRCYVARYKKRRSANGHRIIYRQIPSGIRVIRILHTSMNWETLF